MKDALRTYFFGVDTVAAGFLDLNLCVATVRRFTSISKLSCFLFTLFG